MILRDTSNWILKKQLEIHALKSAKERWLMSFDMIQMGFFIVQQSILKRKPDISDIDLRIAVFKRIYQMDYTELEMDKIIAAMRIYFEQKEKKCT
jgi:hypothetical protein